MRARLQPDNNEGFAAGVDEVPWRVVDSDMDMPNAWRHIECAFAKYWNDAKVLRPILYVDATFGQLLGERRIDNQPRRRFVFDRDERGWAANVPGVSPEMPVGVVSISIAYPVRGKLAGYERKQIIVELISMGNGQPVRSARIDLQGRFLQNFRG